VSLEEHISATEGVECYKDQSVIDAPVAYKLIEQVMQAQSDLLEIMLTSKQGLHQRLTIAFIQPKPESKKKPV
jgi:hypothetical protein